MSNLAYAAPRRRPAEPAPRPHIEIAPSREQRRARPTVAYAVITVASLFLIFAAQLLLSIVVSDGAYQIATLQSQQKELLRSQEALTESLDLAASSQNLAINAANLGMVPAGSPLFLDLETGAVMGAPGADALARPGCGANCNLIANDLLTGMVPVTKTPTPPAGSSGAATPTTPGAAPATTAPAPAPITALPAPVTH